MRRLMVLAACATVLFTAVGCNSDSKTSSAPSVSAAASSPAASPSPSPLPSASGPSANAALCNQVNTINRQYGAQILPVYQKLTSQQSSGDTAGAAQSRDQLYSIAKQWAGQLAPLATQADDPGLKQTLGDLVTGVQRATQGEGSLADLQKLITDGQTAFTKYCG
jgi:hypothetical protein